MHETSVTNQTAGYASRSTRKTLPEEHYLQGWTYNDLKGDSLPVWQTGKSGQGKALAGYLPDI